MEFKNIPKELVQLILNQVPKPQNISCSLTCKSWSKFTKPRKYYDSGISICKSLASSGHLSLLQYLFDHGLPLDKSIYNKAAEVGHLDMIRWAMDYLSLSKGACIGAAKGGHFELLRWLKENGFPWDEKVCRYAANGHLEMLQWARGNLCPWDHTSWEMATKGCHYDVLEWLITQEYSLENFSFWASRKEDLDILRWAKSHEDLWFDEGLYEVGLGYIEVLQHSLMFGDVSNIWMDASPYVLEWGIAEGYKEVLSKLNLISLD